MSVANMDLYRKTHKEFFFATASLRNTFGICVLKHLSREEFDKWLSEDEIADFTNAYMMGGEL